MKTTNADCDKSVKKPRKVLTIIVVAACAIVTVIFLVLMLKNYPGMDIAFCVALALSAIIILYLLLRKLRASEKYSRLAVILQRIFLICIAICIAGFIVLQGLIISGSHTDNGDVDCLIILGAGLYGEYPSRVLVSRLDTALEYLKGKDDIPIIVSGGQGPGESITEADAMLRYLLRNGVDEGRVRKEDRSSSTKENIAFSLALLEDSGLDAGEMKVAIVTSEFHLFRAKYIAGQLGLDAIGVAAKTPYPSLRVLYHCREAVALLKDLLISSG